jgi:alkylation response protein AidB-like acyl-CoA dehydrogenase
MNYAAPVPAILFALRHGAQAQRLPDWDDELAVQVLYEAARFVNAEVAPLDPVADARGATYQNGRVTLAPEMRQAYERYRDGGWPSLTCPSEFGGQELSHVLGAAISEMIAGACLSFQMLVGLPPSAARVIELAGNAEQRNRFLPKLVSGEWLSSMCLTEPQAGSDLGRIACQAEATPAGDYALTGMKIFISGGDHDVTDNIVHLILARTANAVPGVRGLSLFVAPALLADDSRNAIACLNIEEKMGLHGSPTCQIALDGAHAEMLGEEGQGLALMFGMMNAARIEVGLQGVGLAQVALQRALAYAGERRQGRTGGDAGPVPLTAHADVQRMLLTQIALTEGCRALLYRVAVEHELTPDSALVNFLTPVCKAFASDSAVEAAQLAIQVHGGYGYLREFRVEQVLRDARITQIYEGANGIHAASLSERGLRQDGGAGPLAFRCFVEAAIGEAVAPMASGLQLALAAWERASAVQLENGAGARACLFLRLTGLLAIGTVWARMESAAEQAPAPEMTRTAATFLLEWMLPECTYLADQIIANAHARPLPSALFAL